MSFDAEKPFALFENQIDNNIIEIFEIFFNPVEEIITYQHEKSLDCFDRISKLSKQGLYLVGYVAYEAMTDFLKSGNSDFPVLHFYAFSERKSLGAADFENDILPILRKSDGRTFFPDRDKIDMVENPLIVYDFQVNETFASYQEKILKIKQYQRQGDTYQVNFTMKNRFKWQGSAFDFFLELKKYQKVSMAAYLHFGRDICSYSPELFIRRDGNLITSKPMKGTAPRGLDASEDELIVRQMREDSKTMSENLMIVDLIRNDLGRIALPGTVTVPKLFEIESYATLHQMTSTVQAQVLPELGLKEIMQALFPCGSITGAPKRSTMKIIQELEAEPRQLYTGALGYILPGGDFKFNVAIRTLILNANSDGENLGEMGIGSGIVYESDIEKEWEECQLKAKFVKLINSPIQLIETFRYEAAGHCFLRLELHLQRLAISAKYLGFAFPVEKIREELDNLLIQFANDQAEQKKSLSANTYVESVDKKIRLLLFQSGGVQLTHSPVEAKKSSYKIICCNEPVRKNSILQRHKTTCRSFYDESYRKAVAQGFDEILFFNEENHCVEASRHNVIIKIGGRYITPPVSDGALPGVYRQSCFQDPSLSLSEASFGLTELTTAEEIFLCNSIRGMIRADIVIG
jgi:para-aminobenzoate synthetase/4-amino-4-deoxychorismate lyase